MENTMKLFDNYTSGADFSKDGQYRYRLWRIWDIDKPYAMCIGLNPSTANAEKNDPTINILIRMLSKLGFGGLYMVNCYAIISSNPKDIIPATAYGAILFNDTVIERTANLCSEVIFAWGTFKLVRENGRDLELIKKFPNAKCFGRNTDNTPMHPLALMYNGTQKNPKLEPYLQPIKQQQ